MRIEKLTVQQLPLLTELFDYNDADQMIAECTRDIQSGAVDIFVLFDQQRPVGELHVRYESDDARYARRGQRAYLFAFRIREELQGRGLGTRLLKTVLALLEQEGYREFTVGVEDDNARAIHMYQAMGFDELLLRTREVYQGDAYEYNLYLKR